MRVFVPLSLIMLLFFHAGAQAQSSIREQVNAALDSDIRTADERARDVQRQPADVLEFLRVEDDMTVIELLPFGGWYTKILGQVLRENGKLYVTQPDMGRYSDALIPTLALDGMDRVVELDFNAREAGEGSPFVGTTGPWDVEPVDMVLTFLNYHNLSHEDRMAVNNSVFAALKPGGYYGVVDHTRRHMEVGTRANGRRFDPVQAIKEIQAAGLVFVDYSDVLHRPADELLLEVGRPEVSGASDRFVFLFMKPES